MEQVKVFKIKEKGAEEYAVRFAPKAVLEELMQADGYDIIPQSKTATKRYFKKANKVDNSKPNTPNILKRQTKYINSILKVKNNRKLKGHEVKGAYMIFNFGDKIKAFKVWTENMIWSLQEKFGINYTLKQGVIIDPRAKNKPIVINLN